MSLAFLVLQSAILSLSVLPIILPLHVQSNWWLAKQPQICMKFVWIWIETEFGSKPEYFQCLQREIRKMDQGKGEGEEQNAMLKQSKIQNFPFHKLYGSILWGFPKVIIGLILRRFILKLKQKFPNFRFDKNIRKGCPFRFPENHRWSHSSGVHSETDLRWRGTSVIGPTRIFSKSFTGSWKHWRRQIFISVWKGCLMVCLINSSQICFGWEFLCWATCFAAYLPSCLCLSEEKLWTRPPYTLYTFPLLLYTWGTLHFISKQSGLSSRNVKLSLWFQLSIPFPLLIAR